MIDFSSQLSALLARHRDVMRRSDEIVDEWREIVEEYARVGRELVVLQPHLAGPINLLVEGMRASAAKMVKVETPKG